MATVSGTSPFGDDPQKLLQGLVAGLQERIVAAYPIRGRIIEVQPEGVVLDVGRTTGVSVGTKLRLAEALESRVELTVTEVGELTSKAAFKSDELKLQPSWRVEELL